MATQKEATKAAADLFAQGFAILLDAIISEAVKGSDLKEALDPHAEGKTQRATNAARDGKSTEKGKDVRAAKEEEDEDEKPKSKKGGKEAAALAAANKRVSNLLGKFDGEVPEVVANALLLEPAEQALAQAVFVAAQAVAPLAAARQYRETLEQLASLREPVDAFFEVVLVNADDAEVRANRYALLAQLRGLFLGVADISLLG